MKGTQSRNFGKMGISKMLAKYSMTGLKPPSGWGRRLIITHIGSKSGFVDEGILTFVSKKTGEYHKDMNSDVFCYHSKKLERVPTLSWLKNEIQSWMTEKNISFPKDSVKRDLLELVKLERHTLRKMIMSFEYLDFL